MANGAKNTTSRREGDALLIALCGALPLGGLCWRIVNGIREETISLLGHEPFTRSHESGYFWFTMTLYAVTSVGIAVAIAITLFDRFIGAKEPIQPPETTRGK